MPVFYPSNFLPKLLGYFFIPAVIPLAVFGNIYCGTITETVTVTDDPSYYVGQTFIGSYEYESPACDGDFGPFPYTIFNSSALPTLKFSLFTFLPIGQDGWLSLDETNFKQYTHLVVTSNVVTDFYLTGQYGGADPNFRFSEFYIPNGLAVIEGQVRSTYTAGTMSFSAPVPVPDGSTPTVAFVALGLLGIAVLRSPGLQKNNRLRDYSS